MPLTFFLAHAPITPAFSERKSFVGTLEFPWLVLCIMSRICRISVLQTWILQRVCSAVLGARKAAKEVCTTTALSYRTTTRCQSLTTMAQTERAANQGPAKLRLENYAFVKIVSR